MISEWYTKWESTCCSFLYILFYYKVELMVLHWEVSFGLNIEMCDFGCIMFSGITKHRSYRVTNVQ